MLAKMIVRDQICVIFQAKYSYLNEDGDKICLIVERKSSEMAVHQFAHLWSKKIVLEILFNNSTVPFGALRPFALSKIAVQATNQIDLKDRQIPSWTVQFGQKPLAF